MIVEVGGRRLWIERGAVEVFGEWKQLGPVKFKILVILLEAEGKPVPREVILERLGKKGLLERGIDVHISLMRTKLGISKGVLECISGKGYRWDERMMRLYENGLIAVEKENA